MVLDRADVLSGEALEYFATLAEDPHVDLALIAIGSPAWSAGLPKRARTCTRSSTAGSAWNR